MKENTTVFPHIYPLGDAALVVAFGNSISPEVHVQIRALSFHLSRHPIEGLIEWVPAYTTLTLFYDYWQLYRSGKQNPYHYMHEQLNLLLQQLPKEPGMASRLLEIPVCYGGGWGPDLEAVAQHTGRTPAEVIHLHTQNLYTVYMIGFAPGFPYLGGMDERLACPRKSVPRTTIPAGSVGIAGNQTGIYPMETPGGWQLIGRSPLLLFDLQREKPSLLQMGDRVRFFSISEKEYRQLERRRHER